MTKLFLFIFFLLIFVFRSDWILFDIIEAFPVVINKLVEFNFTLSFAFMFNNYGEIWKNERLLPAVKIVSLITQNLKYIILYGIKVSFFLFIISC